MSDTRDLYYHLLMEGVIEPAPAMEPAIVSANPRYQQNRRGAAWWDLDGVKYRDAPAPPLFHKHWAQSVFNLPMSDERWRCPCGAYRDPHGAWYQQEWHVTGKRRWKGLFGGQ